ncbi:YcnI family protein [Microbacterium indicum]|uniref:YcnI family copper-binding membrane protein n=1 Tax=Microbacterium indicum TaxID=358100 RepID=UPI00041C1CD2|nr:YcnI family protein [Microbacterium indicum]
MTITQKNRALRYSIGAIAVAAGLVLVPAAAQAHVGLTSEDPAVAGADAELTFGFNHGCDGSATTALAITLPDGLTGVHPVQEQGWTIDVARDNADGSASSVTYTADTPIAADLRGEVRMLVGIDESAEGSLAFPVEQVCESGSESWSEVAEAGQSEDDLESPAPVLALASASEAATPEPEAAADDQGSTIEPVTLTVTIAALVVAVGALITAITGARRRC